jgi:hypothetical protein
MGHICWYSGLPLGFLILIFSRQRDLPSSALWQGNGFPTEDNAAPLNLFPSNIPIAIFPTLVSNCGGSLCLEV